jgi:polysaccharide deacetylase family protein (PEP-CTERM system associated)
MPIKIDNAMTVDVEDYFQVSAFEKVINRHDWDSIACRVEANTNRILELFNYNQVKATFFMLGWLAERYPILTRRIVDEGHELASHGYDHTRVINQNPSQFKQDIEKTKKILEDLSGVEVKGYRAASYSIGEKNLWAIEELKNAGYTYSSSIYPVKHDLYGMHKAPRFAFKPRGDDGVLEIPVTTIELFKEKLPAGGGGFFRLYPYFFSRWALRQVNKKDQRPAIFYFHPWEIDVEQPRLHSAPWKSRFRHYLNLDKTEGRLQRLMTDFSWGRMDKIFLDT